MEKRKTAAITTIDGLKTAIQHILPVNLSLLVFYRVMNFDETFVLGLIHEVKSRHV